MTDVFAIQDDISQAIAEKLRLRLAGDRSFVKRPSESLEAFNLYLKGRYYLQRETPEGISKGKECCELAIAADPNYAQAWCGLALFWWYQGYTGVVPAREASARCLEAMHKALELDERLSLAHSCMGVFKAQQFDWEGSEREFRRALELGSEDYMFWHQYGCWHLMPMGRPDEAIIVMRKALETDPLSPFLHFSLGVAYFAARKYDQSIEQYRNALELDPHYGSAHLWLAFSLMMKGQSDEAAKEIEIAMHLMGRSPLYLGALGLAYGRAARILEAREILAELQDLVQKTYVPPFYFVYIYLGLREIDKCFDWMEKSIEAQDFAIFSIAWFPIFDPLRSHPRYRALLRRMNLIDAPQ
jgi:serine/threonine-protein kinase